MPFPPSEYAASLLLAAHWLICGYIHMARPEAPLAVIQARLQRLPLASGRTYIMRLAGVYMIIVALLLTVPEGCVRALGSLASLPVVVLMLVVHAPRRLPRGLDWEPWEYATFARLLALTSATIMVMG